MNLHINNWFSALKGTYLRYGYLWIENTFKVFCSYIISKLYAVHQNISYNLKTKLNSFCHHLICVFVRSFGYSLSRSQLLEKFGSNSKENICYKSKSDQWAIGFLMIPKWSYFFYKPTLRKYTIFMDNNYFVCF